MKRTYFLSAAIGLAITVLGTTSLFASGVALTGVGARATALGGCYRGIANDWSAMYWNPAGLTQIAGMHFGGSLEAIMPKAKYTPAKWNSQDIEDFSVINTGETENESRTFFIPAAGFAYGLEDMAFGVGFFVPFGLGAKWDLLDTERYNASYPAIDFEDNLKVIDIHPSFAYQLSDKLSMGLGVSIIYADILIRKPAFTPNPYFKPEFEQFRSAALEPLGGMDPAFNHLLTESKLEGDGMGFGGNIGLMFRATDDLQVGLSAQYYADVILEGKVDATTYFATNQACHQAIEANLKSELDKMVRAGLISQEEYGALLYYYSGGSQVKYDNVDADATLPLPMNAGIGLSYSGINNLVASFDVDWTQWSSWDIIDIEMAGVDTTELVEKWEDTIQFGVGLEYSLEMLKLRAFFRTSPSAIPDETMTAIIPDVNRRNTLSLGIGYDLGDMSLHANFEHIFISDRDVPAWQPSADQKEYDNMAGLYKMNVNNLMLGVEYNF